MVRSVEDRYQLIRDDGKVKMTYPSMHQPLPTELFATIIDSTPLISIDLIVRDENDNILLGERLNAPARGFWFTPGGRIYKNESLAQAFERITSAELGVAIAMSEASFHGVYEHFYEDSAMGDHISTHYVVLAYNVTLPTTHHPLNTNHPLVNDQHQSYKWIDVQSLLADPTVHTHVKWYFS